MSAHVPFPFAELDDDTRGLVESFIFSSSLVETLLFAMTCSRYVLRARNKDPRFRYGICHEALIASMDRIEYVDCIFDCGWLRREVDSKNFVIHAIKGGHLAILNAFLRLEGIQKSGKSEAPCYHRGSTHSTIPLKFLSRLCAESPKRVAIRGILESAFVFHLASYESGLFSIGDRDILERDLSVLDENNCFLLNYAVRDSIPFGNLDLLKWLVSHIGLTWTDRRKTFHFVEPRMYFFPEIHKLFEPDLMLELLKYFLEVGADMSDERIVIRCIHSGSIEAVELLEERYQSVSKAGTSLDFASRLSQLMSVGRFDVPKYFLHRFPNYFVVKDAWGVIISLTFDSSLAPQLNNRMRRGYYGHLLQFAEEVEQTLGPAPSGSLFGPNFRLRPDGFNDLKVSHFDPSWLGIVTLISRLGYRLRQKCVEIIRDVSKVIPIVEKFVKEHQDLLTPGD